MKKNLRIYLIAALMIISTASSIGQVRITEAMSNSGTGGTADWIEVTNLGSTAVDITGWKVDDSSFALATALTLNGVTSIPAGKSVIFMETAAPTTDIPTFKTFWGTSLDNVSVGSYTGSGIGLSSGGDGVILFDASGTEVTRLSFGAATAGFSFYWSYNATGALISAATGVASTVGTINGTVSNQVTITSANVLANVASPGTAIVFPINANISNASLNPWRLEGKTLKFDVMPVTAIEIYALTGSKVYFHNPAQNINLDLKQGIYIV